MSKLTTFLEGHASAIDGIAGVLSVLLNYAPINSIEKTAATQALTNVKQIADGLHLTAGQIGEEDEAALVGSLTGSTAQTVVQPGAGVVTPIAPPPAPVATVAPLTTPPAPGATVATGLTAVQAKAEADLAAARAALANAEAEATAAGLPSGA